jgi:hypothetical protein
MSNITKEDRMKLEKLVDEVSEVIDKAQSMDDALNYNYFFQKFVTSMMSGYVDLLALIDPKNVLEN